MNIFDTDGNYIDMMIIPVDYSSLIPYQRDLSSYNHIGQLFDLINYLLKWLGRIPERNHLVAHPYKQAGAICMTTVNYVVLFHITYVLPDGAKWIQRCVADNKWGIFRKFQAFPQPLDV